MGAQSPWTRFILVVARLPTIIYCICGEVLCFESCLLSLSYFPEESRIVLISCSVFPSHTVTAAHRDSQTHPFIDLSSPDIFGKLAGGASIATWVWLFILLSLSQFLVRRHTPLDGSSVEGGLLDPRATTRSVQLPCDPACSGSFPVIVVVDR